MPYQDNDPYSVGGGTIVNLQEDFSNTQTHQELNIVNENENDNENEVTQNNYDQININVSSH